MTGQQIHPLILADRAVLHARLGVGVRAGARDAAARLGVGAQAGARDAAERRARLGVGVQAGARDAAELRARLCGGVQIEEQYPDVRGAGTDSR